MNVNFDQPMTFYEMTAIVISITAVILPFVIKIYCYFFKKVKLEFIENGDVKLFFNQSGGYIRLNGVYESQNQQSIIRNIAVRITRVNDSTTFNFDWSYFVYPATQNFSNNSYIETIETAHPILITKNSLFPAFIVFCDRSESAQTAIHNYIEPLINQIPIICMNKNSYESAYNAYINNSLYASAKIAINNEFIWKAGKYTLEIEVKYNSKKKYFSYDFEISEHEYKKLQNNIDEIIICNLKQRFSLNYNFYVAHLALHKKK